VCVFSFDLCVVFIVFFVFILVPCHKSHESMKIGPHPRGHPSSDLHLGQKRKVGGRYADNSLIYISYFVGPLYIHVSLSFLFLFLFLLSKTQKDQKYFRCFSLFAFLVF
jgi:hypothetical protein